MSLGAAKDPQDLRFGREGKISFAVILAGKVKSEARVFYLSTLRVSMSDTG